MPKHQPQNKKSYRRFEAIFRRGVALLQANDVVAASDKLLEAALAAPSVWTKHRFYAFERALFLKGDDTHGRQMGTERDFELLYEKFIDNEKEPAHFRAKAVDFVANVKFVARRGGVQGAATLLRFGLHILDEAGMDGEDYERNAFFAPFYVDQETQRDPSLRRVLCTTREDLETLLELTEGGEPRDGSASLDDPFAGRPMPPKLVELRERGGAGGSCCDYCKKTLQEAQLAMFQRCSRCNMTHYCDESCQKKHWKRGGHKAACRKKGQIEVGDDMGLQNMPEEDTDLNDKFVKVIGRVAGTKNRWNVLTYGSNSDTEFELTVTGNQLYRLRPPPFVLEE